MDLRPEVFLQTKVVDVNRYLRLLFMKRIFDRGVLFFLISIFEQSGEKGDSEQELCWAIRCYEISAKLLLTVHWPQGKSVEISLLRLMLAFVIIALGSFHRHWRKTVTHQWVAPAWPLETSCLLVEYRGECLVKVPKQDPLSWWCESSHRSVVVPLDLLVL